MQQHIDFGPLAQAVQDVKITDIVINNIGKVWVDYGHGMREYQPPIPLSTPEIVREYAVQLFAQLGKRLDNACPIADAATQAGVRVHAVISPIVAQGAAISIRIPRNTHNTLQNLFQQYMFPEQWLLVLRSLLYKKANIIITGSTGAGKTTLLRALLEQCDVNERIIAVEEVRELGSVLRENAVSLIVREKNVEGAGEVTLSQLVKATLRMRPDRIILGECRGEEIADVLRAFSSGHRGGIVTMHANSVQAVPARLISLGLLAGVTPQTVSALSAEAFNVILHLENNQGRRIIREIGVLSYENQQLLGKRVAIWDGKHTPKQGELWKQFAKQWVENSLQDYSSMLHFPIQNEKSDKPFPQQYLSQSDTNDDYDLDTLTSIPVIESKHSVTTL
ncbi:MAG: ATPase, T2SS/T4P/T4SS family [Bifidobacteriaceae bacterium]|nr:ATPase, T2SS/T4P/T4SS family [Bifidobacteriaceae bacterium]